jgi:hypothetical protein
MLHQEAERMSDSMEKAALADHEGANFGMQKIHSGGATTSYADET